MIINTVITRHMLGLSRRFTLSSRQIVYNSGCFSCCYSNTKRLLFSSSFNIESNDNNNSSSSSSRHRWSTHEDWLLRRGVYNFGTDWKQVVLVYLPHLSVSQCAHRWRLSLDPSHKISSFTVEEDNKLRELVREFGEENWKVIGANMEGRHPRDCRMRWITLSSNAMKKEHKRESMEMISKSSDDSCSDVSSTELNQSPLSESTSNLPSRSLVFPQYKRNVKMPRQVVERKYAQTSLSRPRQWTPEEDQRLENAIEEIGLRDWTAVAKLVETRDREQCHHRYYYLRQLGAMKQLWTSAEDETLRLGVEQYSEDVEPNWAVIATNIPRHTARDCKTRWEFYLARQLNMTPWSEEEDEILIALRKENLPLYPISRKLPGRTIESIKARCDEIGMGFYQVKEPWSEEDVKILKQAVEEFTVNGRINWRKVSKRLPGRSGRSIVCKYNNLVKPRHEKSTPPSTSD